MGIRLLKIAMAKIVAGLALFYALQNMMNLDAAYGAFTYVMSMTDVSVYGNSFGPAITSPTLVWLAVILIVGAEFLAGILAAHGAWDMWKARKGSDAEFAASKTRAILGAGVGVVVWFGFFGVVGGAYFQMWQTELGSSSLSGAFQYAVTCAVALIYLSMKDE